MNKNTDLTGPVLLIVALVIGVVATALGLTDYLISHSLHTLSQSAFM
jgi:hypothetical protein